MSHCINDFILWWGMNNACEWYLWTCSICYNPFFIWKPSEPSVPQNNCMYVQFALWATGDLESLISVHSPAKTQAHVSAVTCCGHRLMLLLCDVVASDKQRCRWLNPSRWLCQSFPGLSLPKNGFLPFRCVYVCCCCCCCLCGGCFWVCWEERQRGSGPFLLYNCWEGFLCSLQKPFPLLFQMAACSRGLEEQCCALILWLTGVSCFTVSQHYTPHFGKWCMSVHVRSASPLFGGHSVPYHYLCPSIIAALRCCHRRTVQPYQCAVSEMSQHAALSVVRLFKAQGTTALVIQHQL